MYLTIPAIHSLEIKKKKKENSGKGLYDQLSLDRKTGTIRRVIKITPTTNIHSFVSVAVSLLLSILVCVCVCVLVAGAETSGMRVKTGLYTSCRLVHVKTKSLGLVLRRISTKHGE